MKDHLLVREEKVYEDESCNHSPDCYEGNGTDRKSCFCHQVKVNINRNEK